MSVALTEAAFQQQVTDLAEVRGWGWAHFRPARTANGWRTPVSGPLGAGWPDLVLVRGERLIFAELKAARGRLSTRQRAVLEALGRVAAYRDPPPRVEVFVWHPSDFPEIQELLR